MERGGAAERMEEGGEFRNGLNLDTIVACKVDAPDGPAVYIYILLENTVSF